MLKIGGQKVPTKTLVLLLSESLLIVLGLALATAMRFASSRWEYAGGNPIVRFLIVVLMCEFALYYNDLYDVEVMKSRSRLLIGLLQALGVACIGLAMIYYITPGVSLGRGIAAFAIPTIMTLIFGWRVLLDSKGLFLSPQSGAGPDCRHRFNRHCSHSRNLLASRSQPQGPRLSR